MGKRTSANNSGRLESFEKTLFKAADKLRKNMDATAPAIIVKFFKEHAKL